MEFIWPAAGVALGTFAATNRLYEPRVTLVVGMAAWLIDMVLILIMFLHPLTVRPGVLVTGLLLAIPCFVRTLPVYRFVLMCCMALPFAFAAMQLFVAPTAGLGERLAYVFTWMGTREVKRRPHSFNPVSLRHLMVATFVYASSVAAVNAVSPSGIWWLARWLAGGIGILAFAEMLTAGHDFLTALTGLRAPALMHSPHLSHSIGEFWARRWNPAASALLFGKFFFKPLARRGVGLALFAAFFGSAVVHVLLLFMAAGRWGISLMWGTFFIVQPLFIAVERRIKVRRWGAATKRAWALAVLAIVSPLFIEPMLQLGEPIWLTNNVVLLTAETLGLVILVCGFVSLGSLASIADLTQTDYGTRTTRVH